MEYTIAQKQAAEKDIQSLKQWIKILETSIRMNVDVTIDLMALAKRIEWIKQDLS